MKNLDERTLNARTNTSVKSAPRASLPEGISLEVRSGLPRKDSLFAVLDLEGGGSFLGPFSSDIELQSAIEKLLARARSDSRGQRR